MWRMQFVLLELDDLTQLIMSKCIPSPQVTEAFLEKFQVKGKGP